MTDLNERSASQGPDEATPELSEDDLDNVAGGVKVDFDPGPLNH